MDFIANIDWSSVVIGAVGALSTIYGYWKLIPAKKKENAKAALKDGLSDSKFTLEDAAKVALELL